MIKLERVRFQTNQSIFPLNIKKGLRISIQHIVRTSKEHAKFINQNCIEWQEHFFIPVLYNKQLSFEVFNVHKFGYNPQQLQIIYSGQIIIQSPEENHSAWEVFNSKKQRMGFLSANIRTIKSIRPEGEEKRVPEIFDTDPKMLTIKSLVIYLPAAKNKKVYVEVNVGGNRAQTMNRKSQSGSLVFLQELNLYKDQAIHEAIFSIYEADIKKELIATGRYKLKGEKPEKNVALCNDIQNIGEMYVDGTLTKRDLYKNKKYLSYFITKKYARSRQGTQIDSKFDQVSSNYQNQPSIKSEKFKKSQMSYYSKLPLMQDKTDIFFKKQKKYRVQSPRSKPNSPKNKSVDFKSSKAKFHRGPSIGYGKKSDFTKAAKQIPGVGSYNLPSIFQT